MVLFDTNMILRYLLNDNEEMAERSTQCLENGDILVTIEVIAEVVYVLRSVYSLKRETIADAVTTFLDLVICRERKVVILALKTYEASSLDFVDCVLYAYHKVEGIEIATFDKKLIKLLTRGALMASSFVPLANCARQW